MATNDTRKPQLRTRTRDNTPYEIPFDDTPPEEFVEAAKQLIDSRLVEKLWDQFIEQLTEQTVHEGPLLDYVDSDTEQVAADWVVDMAMRRFGFQFMGVPMEYKVGWPETPITSLTLGVEA